MRTDVWDRLMKRHVVPALPGLWVQLAGRTVRPPHRHLAWMVARSVPKSGGMYLTAVPMPLFTWNEWLQATVAARPLGGRQHKGRYFSRDEAEAMAEDPERNMPVILNILRSEAVPHLQATAASVYAYLRQLQQYADSRSDGLGNGHSDGEEAACHLLLGDTAGAREAYGRVLRVAAKLDRPLQIILDGRPVTLPDSGRPEWVQGLVDTAEKRLALSDAELLDARAELLRVEDAMREHWMLPEPEQSDAGVGLL